MAIINSCNKHNMIACVEKTERNADFHEVIDFLTGCSVSYALLVSPDILVTEALIRADLLFNDEDGIECFTNQNLVVTGSLHTVLSTLDVGNLGMIGAADSRRTSATLILDEVLKLKNFKKDAALKLFKSTKQERYEHVGLEVTSSQDG
ncbi:hypothetical protein Tco_1509397 [Tanacetum coccineum]